MKEREKTSSKSNCKDFAEISVCKEQGRRPLLDARGLLALRGHCITHRHDSVIDITKWAQEYFQETTVDKHNPPCHLQMPTKALSCKKEAICEHGPEVPSCPVGVQNGKVFYGQMSPNLTFLLEIMDAVSSTKEEGDLPACYQLSVQKPASLMVWGAYVHMVWAAYMVWKAL